ncbi:molybdate ABC transporter permease subunit [uncultured Campylobacter sp.]|uniref:molybdate ABC transporter permease subunit n=1 Tax=uncultured Campylobacter sp. TaxID=218934 RepID=UPI002603555B|nr:molybdate ABC transporter permease subunit [uncultured Campylobacter sp.]
MIDWTPFLLSFKLAFISTIILFFICLPLAYIIARSKFKLKPIIESIISLPLVLPPSVLGFYILIFLSPYSFLGEFMQKHFDIRLVFNFTGLVIASCIYSLPFMFSPILSGFKSLPNSLIEASYSLGKGKITTLFKVAMPNIKPSLLSAIIISFAHTLGEFGVILMIGGSIEGETKVASIAIYDAVEILDYKLAHIYSAAMLAISFTVLFLVYFINQKIEKK